MSSQRPATDVAAAGDRRGALVDAAIAVVRESGFGAATVKAVTARAGMSAGLLYRYADGVEELLADVFRRCAGAELAAVDRAVTAAPDDAVARLTALVDAFATRALRGRRLAWALLVEPVGRAVEEERLAYRRGYADLLEEIIRRGVGSGRFAPQDPRITAAGLVGAIGEALAGPLSPVAEPADPADIRSEIARLCLRAVGAPTPLPGDPV